MGFLMNVFFSITLFIFSASAFDGRLCEQIQFAVDFYRAVHEDDPTNNVIISPLSVQTALGVLMMAAEGSTADQIAVGSHFHTIDRTLIAYHLQDILERYHLQNVLKIANKVYVKSGYTIKPNFLEFTRKYLYSEVESVSFANNYYVAGLINSWVEQQTERKIRNLFSPYQIAPTTRMVLVNAIYFKGLWRFPFHPGRNTIRDFWVSDAQSVKVEMMYNNMFIKYGFFAELDSKIAVLPYKHTNASMLIILPNKKTGLDQLEHKLNVYDFSNVENRLHLQSVDVWMPKLQLESTVDLQSILSKMGMAEMFSHRADFPHLLQSPERLRLDNAVHKTYININEEGTEAASATGIQAIPMILPETLMVDRPFFFAIVGPYDVSFVGSVRKV